MPQDPVIVGIVIQVFFDLVFVLFLASLVDEIKKLRRGMTSRFDRGFRVESGTEKLERPTLVQPPLPPEPPEPETLELDKETRTEDRKFRTVFGKRVVPGKPRG